MVGHIWCGTVRPLLNRRCRHSIVVSLVLLALTGSVPASRADITSGLVAHWKLNETSGTTAADSSGNGRNGTYTNGPTLNQSGQCKTSVRLDGTNDYVSLPTGVVNGLTNCTIAVWFNLDTVSNWARIFDFGSGTNVNMYLTPRNGSNSKLRFAITTSGSSGEQMIDTTTTVSTGSWYHVVITLNGSVGTVYVNGVQVGQNTSMTRTPNSLGATSQNYFGRSQYSADPYLDGRLDDFRIYSRAFSASDVNELYGLALYEKLDESSGTTAADSSMYERSGTVTGTSSWGSAVRYNGFAFNGSTKIQVTGLLDSPSSFTLAAWANLTAADTSGAEIISLGDRVYLRLDESGVAKVAFYNGSSFVTATYAVTHAGTGWHHFAGVFDNSGDTLKLYVDGAQVASTSTTSNISYSGGGSNTVIGRHGNGSTSYDFTGTIDDVRVYNYALSNADIVELYGLVGYWKLNETSGTSAADSSGIGNNGSVSGSATWTSAVHGNGFSADYTNGEDYIQIANSTSLQDVQEDSYSLAAWFKPTNLPPGSGSANTAAYRIIGKTGWHLGLVYDYAGEFYVEHWLGTTPTWYGAGAWFMNSPGKWYHVAGVIDRDAGTIKLYLDGSLIQTATFTAGATAYEYGTTPWRIGISSPSASNWGHAARGVIDDVRVYNRAIMPSEVAKLAGLLGHWKMDEGSGTTAADSSGQANNATLAGGASWTTDCAGNNNALLTNGAGGIAQTASAFTPPDEGTVAFWLRSTGAPAGTARILGLGGDWEIRQGTDGRLISDLCGDGSTTIGTTTALTEVGHWYHVAINFDSADDTYAIYVDGQLEKSGTNPSAMSQQAAAVLSFGTRTGSTEYWSGALRDMRIYNRKLFPYEIAQLYGLIGRWKLVETSGTTAADQTLLANNGTYTNGVSLATSASVPGYGAVAAKFDGLDDYVNVSNESDFDITGPITVAAWVRADLFSGTYASFVTKGDVAWRLRYRPDISKLSFKCTGLSTEELLSDGALLPNRWYHIAGVYTGSQLQLYINGTLNTSVSSAGSIGTNDYAVNLARNAQQAGRYFKGAIYDARVYNRALCPTEISQLYGSAFTGVKIIKWEEIQ